MICNHLYLYNTLFQSLCNIYQAIGSVFWMTFNSYTGWPWREGQRSDLITEMCLAYQLCYSIMTQRLDVDTILMEMYDIWWQFDLWPTHLTLNGRLKVTLDIRYVISMPTFLFKLNTLQLSISHIKGDRTRICMMLGSVLFHICFLKMG